MHRGTRERDIASGLDPEDGVRASVARHHQPRPAAGNMLPQLAMHTRWVVAQVDIVDPTLPCGIVERMGRIGRRTLYGSVAEVGELPVAARTAIAAVDPHRLRLQCRLGWAP